MKEMFPPKKCPKCGTDTVVMHYKNGYRVECPKNPQTQYPDLIKDKTCDWYGEFVFDKEMKIPKCKHKWEQKADYPEDIICRKCETIKKVSTLTRQQFLKLPIELRRSLLSYQANNLIESLPCGLFGENNE